MNESTCPIFIAAPFIVPSAATICSAASMCRRSSAAVRPSGERVTLAAERIEAETLALERDITGRDARLSGRLRLTASETLAYRVLPRLLAEFHRRHPGIRVELIIDNRQLDLARREADVALRATRPGEPTLFGRKIADIEWTIYGSASYLETRGTPGSLADCVGHDFIGWDEGADTAAARWLAEAVPETAIVFRSSSLINQLGAAAAGMGLAVLPCYLGDADTGLQRMSGILPEINADQWLLVHRDLRDLPRVRAVMDSLVRLFQEERAALEGLRGEAPSPVS